MSKSWKVTKILSRSALLWLVAGVWFYVVSPRIWYLKYNISKEVKQNLDNCKFETLFTHEDRITTDIINLMSWTISYKELTTLLMEHWYAKSQLPLEEDIWDRDEVLNNVIRDMHTKLGNPKIQFRWNYKNYQTWIENLFCHEQDRKNIYEHDRPRYNFNTNTISIYNLDSIKFIFDLQIYKDREAKSIFNDDGKIWFNELDSVQDPQRLLINNWIAELAHSLQNIQDGFFRSQIDIAKDFCNCWFDYGKTYNIRGMVEYEAHEIYEPEMIKSFINLYIKYADLSDPELMYKIAKFYWWYFDKYKDYDLSSFWLEKAAIAGKVEAANMLANRAHKLLLENYNDYYVNEDKKDLYLDKTLYRYSIADYHSDSKIYAEKLIRYCVDYKYNPGMGINYCEQILKNYYLAKDQGVDPWLIFYYLHKLQSIEYEQCNNEIEN